MIIPSIVIRQDKAPGRTRPWGAFWRDKGRKSALFFKTEAEANQFRDGFVAALKRAPDPEPAHVIEGAPGTIGEYLADWLKLTVKVQRERATYRSYEQRAQL